MDADRLTATLSRSSPPCLVVIGLYFQMSITVRIADYRDPVDAESIISLMREYMRIESCEREDLERLPSLLAEQNGAFSILAFLGGNQRSPIGLITCFMGFSTFEFRPLVNIHDVIVTKTSRGQGVAGEMLRQVDRVAKERDACRITLEVLGDNASAIRAYEKYGFGGDPAHPGTDLYYLRKNLKSD